ncbi:lyase family protein, partial [Campylobacter coli]
MKNEMWSGRFSEASNELLKEFNASLNIDRALYVEDIQGSIAHATMLENCGILKKDELEAIVKGLEQVRVEIEQNRFVFNIEDEDIHMAIEKRLSELIGSEIGGRLHTARSR